MITDIIKSIHFVSMATQNQGNRHGNSYLVICWMDCCSNCWSSLFNWSCSLSCSFFSSTSEEPSPASCLAAYSISFVISSINLHETKKQHLQLCIMIVNITKSIFIQSQHHFNITQCLISCLYNVINSLKSVRTCTSRYKQDIYTLSLFFSFGTNG